jgi:hypothetical protein
MMVTNEDRSVSFVAISGIDFPVRNRKYLMNLVKEIAEKHDAKFIVVAGYVLAGKYLEKQLKDRQDECLKKLREENKKKAPADREPINVAKVKMEVRGNLVKEMAEALRDFLPRVKNANYHIVAAEKIYDRPLGCKILDELNKMRDDVRLASKLDQPVGDMEHDPETKIPVQLPGFGDIRVLVPRKTPWFYENVTGLTQRLINSFAARTFSPPPPLILAGCTGTGAFLPKYRGVPSIAVPALHKLDEQQSTENMVGCTVVTIRKESNGFRIVWKVYDFRTAVFNERDLALPDNLSTCHRRILDVLKPSSASLNTIQFRLNETAKRPWNPEKVKKCLEELAKRGLVVYIKRANRYAIAESLIAKANISLEEFLKEKKEIKFVQKSCWHVGALKTLYYTVLRDEPNLAEDADAIILNGDGIQGISHNYEYNGELLPTMNGADKHQIFEALMQRKIMMEIFKRRWEASCRSESDMVKLVKKCLKKYIKQEGNHDENRFSGNKKHAISMEFFESEFKQGLLMDLVKFLEEKKRFGEIGLDKLSQIVEEKVVRVGESRVAWVNDVPIGLQHPRQGKTKAKGARIQETAGFFAQSYKDSPDERLRNIPLVGVANFHEAAAIFTSFFGRTIFGVMTGAQVYTTVFEGNINKVVEYGMAKVAVELNSEGKILSGQVEYSCQSPSDIAKEDQKIVYAERLDSETVSKHCLELSKLFNIPWR